MSGSIAIDRIMKFSGRFRDVISPDKLDSLAISPLMDSLNVGNGGVGANICYNLALLGDEPILLGSVGRDGINYMEHLASHGVNTSYVHESDLSTATYQGIIDADQSHIGGFYPGAMSDSDALTLLPWQGQDVIVVVAPHDPKAMVRQIEECKKWGLRLCYDISWQVNDMAPEKIIEGIEAAEIFILNEHEMDMVTKRTGWSKDKIASTVPVVIVTHGKNGSVIEGKKVGEPVQIAIAQPKQVADPTSAGDAYRAGFLYGYARSWPIKACGQLGAVISAYTVENFGNQTHHFTLEEVAKRYKENFNEDMPS